MTFMKVIYIMKNNNINMSLSVYFVININIILLPT